jgi:hypothetical protein
MPPGLLNSALGGGGGLAGGERRPEEGNMWCGSAIGLTTRRLVVLARPEMTPASGNSEVTAARPLRPVKLGAGKLNARPWELEGDVVKG